MKKTISVTLSARELDLLITALPYVGDREIEEEMDPDARIGEECDKLQERLLVLKKVQS